MPVAAPIHIAPPLYSPSIDPPPAAMMFPPCDCGCDPPPDPDPPDPGDPPLPVPPQGWPTDWPEFNEPDAATAKILDCQDNAYSLAGYSRMLLWNMPFVYEIPNSEIAQNLFIPGGSIPAGPNWICRRVRCTDGNGDGIKGEGGGAHRVLIDGVSIANVQEYCLWLDGTHLKIVNSRFEGSAMQHPVRLGSVERLWMHNCDVIFGNDGTKGCLWCMMPRFAYFDHVRTTGIFGIGPNENEIVDGHSTINDRAFDIRIHACYCVNPLGYAMNISSGTFRLRVTNTIFDKTPGQPLVGIGMGGGGNPPLRPIEELNWHNCTVREFDTYRPLALADVVIHPALMPYADQVTVTAD